MAFVFPTVADFKSYFLRDFPYGVTLDTVTDTDISNAMTQTVVNINQGLFADQAAFNLGYLLLTAHYMVISLQTSSQGVASQFDWLTTGKGAGSVNQSLQIPQRLIDNPEFAFLSKTSYGAQYLIMVLPLLSGQMFSVCGGTQP